MDEELIEDDENQHLEELKKMFYEILQDASQLKSNTAFTEKNLIRTNFCAGQEIDVLKDQVAFLAKRILALHYSHEETKNQVQILVASVNGAEDEKLRHDEIHPNSNQPAVLVLSVETQTDSNSSEDYQDSGLTRSSTSSSAAGSTPFVYQSHHDLVHDEPPVISSREETACSETTTLTPCVYLFSVKWTRLLLKSLISAEVAYTGKLKMTCRQLDRLTSSSADRSWNKQVEDLFFRHTLFLEFLTCLKDQHQYGLQMIRADHVMVHLLRFWSDQETIELYVQLLCNKIPFSESGEIFAKNSETSRREHQGESDLIVQAYMRDHILCLSSYLKGVRDTSCPDVHLEHVLSILLHILHHPVQPAEETYFTAPSTVNALPSRKSSIQYEKVHEKLDSEFYVQFIEGITFSMVQINTSDYPESNEQDETPETRHSSRWEDEEEPGQKDFQQPILRKTSWRKYLIKIFKQAWYSDSKILTSNV